MTDDEKREVLAHARATVEGLHNQRKPICRNDDEKRCKKIQERREVEPEPYRETDAVRARRLAAEHERT
jgi:hypothetical protein